jgi:hypothetical protein
LNEVVNHPEVGGTEEFCCRLADFLIFRMTESKEMDSISVLLVEHIDLSKLRFSQLSELFRGLEGVSQSDGCGSESILHFLSRIRDRISEIRAVID